MRRNTNTSPSEFINVKGIEYFNFEEDFMEDNVRCIPMVVRFKMDAAGVKLKLSEWSKFQPEERVKLALMPTNHSETIESYHQYLVTLIAKYTGNTATELDIDQQPAWANLNQIPEMLVEKSNEIELNLSLHQWESLTDIQRFALLKLCRPGHENKNFPKAVKEFGLLSN
ncbi:nitrate reductase maturation protein NarM [Pedobacter petrophilus]|uniref:Nitrate reductase maturation protein NarM n=1 Tax=Pedobacter petrophilus TaxID=1908241 RepID=A0A7K0G6R2_9SPHI|nr:nitrate reductase associated protein [Pedobacter petrophilus]MRX78676.1 nitrate reductase maturation protein NarM [Pedobacter petrophilus]